MKCIVRQRLLATTLLVGAGIVSTPAFAQDQTVPDAAQPGTEVPEAAEQPTPTGPAEGQPAPEAQATGEPREGGEEIIVTGTRIARPNVESASPVTVVGEEAIEQAGTTRVEDLVNTLPQVTPGQTAFVSNGATGTATVNLRGLGAARTLVLVNGRRLQPGDPFLPVADLNQIPASLVKRIEVLTGGASSTYGADAVAGVVNFIMDTDFRGFQLDGTYSFYQHDNHSTGTIDHLDETGNPQGGEGVSIRDRMNTAGFDFPRGNVVDGAIFDVTATLGASFDDGRGNAVAYVGYRQVQPLLQAKRDHSSCGLVVSGQNAGDPTGDWTCGGSATAAAATILDLTGGYYFFASAGPGEFIPYQGPYNFAPVNYFQRPDKRWTAGAFANYEISPAIQPYAEFMFMDDRSKAQIAESGTFFADIINISCDSPLLSPTQGDQLCDALDIAGLPAGVAGDAVGDRIVPILIGKRNVEGGPRVADLRHTGYRAVLGTRGDLSDRFSYDISGTYGSTIFSQTYLNDFSRQRLRRSLDAVSADVDGDGIPEVVCAVNADDNPSNDDPACVPYNPFQGIGIVDDVTQGITQEALNYVQTPGLQRGETKNYGVTAYVTGELFNLAATEPVTAVVGAEYLKRMLDLQSDVAFESGDLAGQGGPSPSVSGKYDSKELFAELLVPIVSDRPFLYRLTAELGYRYSDYSLGFSTDTYKIMGEWQPIRELKIRGGYNRAVRAPNILELFVPNALALWSGTDPCAGPDPELTVEECVNTGLDPSRYGLVPLSPADQYNQIIGGNPDLTPEKADTWTVGVVIEPRQWLPGFVATIDYFNIKVKNAIANIGAETIVTVCGQTGDATLCDLVNRNEISGDLWIGSDPAFSGHIVNTTLNIGGLSTQGIDVGASYTRQIFSGRANFDITGTYLIDSKFDTGLGVPGDGEYDCVGFHGSICGFPTPKWRHTARVGYTLANGIGFSVRWRHLGAVDVDEFSDDIDLSAEENPDGRANIDAFDWIDVTASANLTERFRVLLGVNNIFDRDPPLMPAALGGDNANTWAGSYDPVGRYVFLKGSLRF
jgi:iron complex outermembrane recepter protein